MKGLVAYLLVAAGGAVGAITRLGIGNLFLKRFGPAWPYGTLFINVTGSFIIGVFVTAATARWKLHPGWVLLVSTGFVGAYTTFSTYEYETQRLLEMGQTARALLYVALSNVLGFGAVWGGVWLGRR
jgi:fluoride exporter